MSVALVKIQVRNDTAQAWAAANPFLSDGEPGAESNTGRLKIGNGIDRWLDLPYVGGDGSGGGTNPITGNIDGGIYTGQPRTVEAGPPQQPAVSEAVVDGVKNLIASWGAATVDDPTSVSVSWYVVETTTTPDDDTTYREVGQSNILPPALNYSVVSEPLPTDRQADYTYRVRATLSDGQFGEYAYTTYRHFPVPQPIEFELEAIPDELGSTGTDNILTVYIRNLSGGIDRVGPSWSFPSITGLLGTESDDSIQIENTAGANTVEQAFFVTCQFLDGPQDAQYAVTRTIQITLRNTSDDPGPGPEPGPDPEDALPLFNWQLVENSAYEPPPSPETISPFRFFTEHCGGNNCVDQYPCRSGTGCNECEVDYVTVQDFTNFTLLWSSPNWQEASIGGIPTPVTQYKKLFIGGSGGLCTNDPIMMIDGSELKLPNPIINVFNAVASDGGLQSTTIWGEYQTIDELSLNGSTATYAILYPRQNGYSQLGVTYGLAATGTVIVTRDGGSTWKFVDIFSNGLTYYHPNGTTGPLAVAAAANAAGMPKAFSRSKSITNGREVLVAMFDRVTGTEPITQWYFTDDHINWYPTTNVDRLPDSATGIWYDDNTNTTYGVDTVNNGILFNGTCSYWKSGGGVPPRPPEAPTFNWTLISGSSAEPPGLGNFEQGGSQAGRPPDNFGNDPETGEPQDLYKWPSGYFPASTFPLIDCEPASASGAGDMTRCKGFEPYLELVDDPFINKTYIQKVKCGLSFYIYLRLSIANLFLRYPNGTGNGDSVTGDKVICYQSPAGNVTDSCVATPMQVSIPTGSFGREIVDFALSNPLYTEIERPTEVYNPSGELVYTDSTLEQIAGAYQILEDVELAGITATYLMLTPRLIKWDDEDGNTVTEQFTGCLLVTRDSGATWEYVDPKGTGTQQINPAEIDSWNSATQRPNSGEPEYCCPTMLSRCWSHKYGRFVVVAMFKKLGLIQGGQEDLLVEQFYYTPDNTNWYPCNEADGNPWPLSNGFDQQPTKLWTDPATGNSYAVDATNTGLLDVNGVCSYWRSVRG